MIVIKNLSKSINNSKILDNISLEIEKGQITTIIGPSGSGKSSLLKCINYLYAPDEGEIFFENKQINNKNKQKFKRKIGLVFQNFHLFSHLTIMENTIFAPINVLKTNRKKALKDGLLLLQKMGIADKADSLPSALSGGQKQRAAIARALAMSPEVMMFDEPTSALDPEMVNEVIKVISDLAKSGITIILVTHEMKLAKALADKIVFLDHGKLIEVTAATHFFENPTSMRAKKFLENIS